MNDAQQPSASAARITRGHSCFACYQRKVKCDGTRPCSACVKHSVECRSVSRHQKASRSREAPTATDYDRLLTRLQRYEELLSAHGVQIEPQQRMTTDGLFVQNMSSPGVKSEDGHMIFQDGHTRFVETPIWRGLSNEFTADLPQLEDDGQSTLVDELPTTPGNFVLSRSTTQSLSSLHPTVPQILMLWQIFLRNFNPLVMIFHAPSVQDMLSEAMSDSDCISSSSEALFFSIYLSAVTTMNEQECHRIMGKSKQALLSSFSSASEQALVNAEFLRCTDLVILHALTLYLLTSRSYLDSQSLWLLSGLASRIGQAMGLHRESSLRKLSLFEAEIRRRLWWQIMILDNRSAKVSGVWVGAAFNTFWDTKRPLSVSDNDLSPLMQELPKEREGPTEMLFCTIRTKIGEYMRQLQAMDKDLKGSHVTCVAQKIGLIDDCEMKLDKSILKQLDSSIPLHLFTLYMARSAFLQMRLSACHPQQYPYKGASLPQEVKDKLFDLALQIIAYDSLTYSNKSLQGYLWHVAMHFPFEAFILALTELLARVKGEEVERAWSRINQAYEDHPELITEAPRNLLYFALGNLTLKAWDRRILALHGDQQIPFRPMVPTPILKLQAQRMSKSSGCEPALQPDMSVMGTQQVGELVLSHAQPEGGSFANWIGEQGQLLQTKTSEMDWDYWNDLLQGHEDPFYDSTGRNVFVG